jgi:hypothetical protein
MRAHIYTPYTTVHLKFRLTNFGLGKFLAAFRLRKFPAAITWHSAKSKRE